MLCNCVNAENSEIRAKVQKCKSAQVQKCKSAQVHKCTSAQVHKCNSAKVWNMCKSAKVWNLCKSAKVWNMCKSAEVQSANTVQNFLLHCTVCDGRFDYAGIFLILNLHHAITKSHNEFLNQCPIVLAFPFPQEKTGCSCLGCNQNMIPGRFETRFPRLSDQ